MRPRSDFVGIVFWGDVTRRARRVAVCIALGACAMRGGSALAQMPASAGSPLAQPTILTNEPLVPPAPAPQLALRTPADTFGPLAANSMQTAVTGTPVDPYPYPLIDFFSVGNPGVLPWSVNPPGDLDNPGGSGGGNGGGASRSIGGGNGGGGAAQNFALMNAGTNHQLRVTASSSIAESHAPGHTQQAEQPSPTRVMQALTLARTADAPNGGTTQPSNFPYVSGLTFETTYTARAAVYEDTTRMGPQAAGGFLPSAIPVEGQPFFGQPARTTVQGTGSSVGLQLNEALPSDAVQVLGIHNVTTYANLIALNAQTSADGSPTSIGLQQAFIQIDNLVLGSMESAFADNDALPPTLDLAGPNARVSVLQTSSTVMGQGRLSYWLHQMPSQQAAFGYAINFSVEQPSPEIESNLSPPKTTPLTQPSTTFARFPDFIGTVKIGQMVEAPTDNPNDSEKSRVFYESWHVQAGGVVRSLGLELGNDSIDESAFGWGVSLSGHYSWPVPCSILPDAVYGSVTYGVGIAHYISDLHTVNLSSGGNDAVLDGTYLRPLAELAYYAGFLHNWSDHWRSLLCYSHVTLDSQGQAKTLYRFGDYASANIEWHRLVNGLNPANPGQTVPYDFHMGLEYIYGRLEELSGASGQDQRISLVAAISK